MTLFSKISNWWKKEKTPVQPAVDVNSAPRVHIGRCKSRHGDVRIISQIGETTYVVEGVSLYSRGASDEQGQMTMFDFEGGPCYVVGQRFPFQDSANVIKTLKANPNQVRNYASVIVTVAKA